ncbi:hypothetical protein JCM24511_00155 [Saitozyma sp. JCM 24511]|nr:hypothetical protein JCM24511_00155 [Saitozyma sp. JCM 24511]
MRTAFVALPLLALAAAHKPRRNHHVKRHADVAPRVVDEGVSWANATELEKRGDVYTGIGTYYYTGLGACGQYSQDSDFMVALNSAQYGGGYPGPQCFKYITIQGNGVTVGGIEILDECPTCGYGSLDLAPGLFTQFAGTDAGTISITWWFNDGSGSSATTTSTSQWTEPSTSTWVAPTSTWTPPTSTSTWAAPSSTSTWVAPTSSSTWVAPSSSSTTSAPSSTITSSTWSSAQLNSTVSYNATTNPFAVVSSVNGTSATASVSAATGSASAGSSEFTQGNLAAINGLVTNYGQIVVVAAGGQSS